MRLRPRFSLRVAWLMLTIVLIGFGVARYYHLRALRLAEHRQNIARLMASKYAIELEDAEDGSEADQKVIGLFLPMGCDDKRIQALLELSRPEDLRHLSLFFGDLTPAQQDRFFAKLAECKSLERLQLVQMNLTEAHVAVLGTLGKLKFLHPGQIPTGSQHLLKGLNQLEDLRLNMDGYAEPEFLRWSLPNLRVLFLWKCRWPELHLTKAGLGRFPLLEQVIVTKESEFDEVLCEPGAMPRLEYLGLTEQAKPCAIAWHALPDTAPRLRGLSVHASQFGFASREQLLRMSKLELLYFANYTNYEKFHDDYRQVSPGITQALYKNQWVNFRRGFKPELQEFLDARPELQFAYDFMDFIGELYPYREELLTHGMGYARDHRPTIHWHPASLNYLYSNSGTKPNAPRQQRPARVISAEQPFLSGTQGQTPMPTR
jgi:hypothetical protein